MYRNMILFRITVPADFIRFIVQFFYSSFLLFKAVVVCRPLELRSGHLTSWSAVEQNNSEYLSDTGLRPERQPYVAVFYNIYIVFFVLCCIFLLDY